jgi:hypothetical protein
MLLQLDQCVFLVLKEATINCSILAEAKYVSIALVTFQAIWLKRILENIGEK